MSQDRDANKRESDLSRDDRESRSTRLPTLSRDRGTVTALVGTGSSRRGSQSPSRRDSPRHSTVGRHSRRASENSVEYVPRRDEAPPRRVVAVVVEDREETGYYESIPVYFETKEQRRHFVRIVYMILAIMLIVDFGMVAIAYFVEPVNKFVRENIVVYIIALIVFLVVYLLLVCIRKLREKSPVNFIMLTILCLTMGYLMACVTAFHNIETILFAVAGTLFVVICVTLFAIFCPCDMTGWGFYLCLAGMALIAIGAVVTIVCVLGYCGKKAWIVHLVLASVFVLLFSIYLAYDTQLILGGKRYALRPNEYVNGAMHLWIDIVNIFLCMLTIGRITTAAG